MLALRLLWRDWRGGELGLLATALTLAVTIVTSVAFVVDRLQSGLQEQSAHFLAADRVLKTSRPIDAAWLQQGRALGLQWAEVISFRSMVYAGESPDAPMHLVSVRAVSPGYPLRGYLEVADRAFGDPQRIAGGPDPGEVWLDSRLLPLLGVDIGGVVYVGDAALTLGRVIISEPDRGGGSWGFGPRLMMNSGDLAATGIIQPGSRVGYRYLFAGDVAALEQFERWLGPRLQPGQQWSDLEDNNPRLYRSMQRAAQFLMLAGAVGVGLAGIAIALAARRFSERHFDHVAVMKALGASSRRVFWLYLNHLLVLAVLAIVLGGAAGWAIQEMLSRCLQEYFRLAALSALTLRPWLIGAFTAAVCLFSFALPPLIALNRVSPLRVLRRDIGLADSATAAAYGAGIAGLTLLMWWYSGSVVLTLSLLVGVGAVLLVVGVVVWWLLRRGAPLGMRANSIWHLALASLRRRGLANSVQVVIFSLSIMLLLVVALVRGALIDDWKLQLPEHAPNHFLVNIAGDQVEPLRSLLREHNIASEPLYPIVRGRLVSVDGDPVQARLRANDPEGNGDSLNRELSLTWSQEVPPDNRIVAGQWWPRSPQGAQVSIESGLAQRLGAAVGDELQFAIGSELLTVTISSVRELNWDSMKPNFYMVMPPSVLAQYPVTYLTSFYLPPDKKPFLNQFLRTFPTITVIEMDLIIEQIRNITRQVSAAVVWILALIVICALLVLYASVQASLDSRYRESAILRALGARRGLVQGSLAAEFCTLGALAGLLAALAAEVAAYALQTRLLDMDYTPHPWVWGVGPLMGCLLIGAAGYIGCRKVVGQPPMSALKVLQ